MDEETRLHLWPSVPSYAYMLQSSLRTGDASAGRSIYARVVKAGLRYLGLFPLNSLVNFYAKTDSPSDACKRFDEIPVRNTSSWNTFLSMYSKLGMVDEAFKIFKRMPERDSVSWTEMIVGYNRSGCYGKSVRMFVRMLENGISPYANSHHIQGVERR